MSSPKIQFATLAQAFLDHRVPDRALQIERRVRVKLLVGGEDAASIGPILHGHAMLISRVELAGAEYVRVLWEDGQDARTVWSLGIDVDDFFDDADIIGDFTE